MYYPMMVDLANKKIIIIGGGKIAYRKAAHFLTFGGNITVVSPMFADEFEKMKSSVHFIEDTYKESYLKDSFIAVAATDNEVLNRQIGIYCKAHAMLCNVVSNQEISSFIVPSTIKRGDLVISVSTSGKSPALAGKIKRNLEKEYDASYEEYVKLLGEIRAHILNQHLAETEKVALLTSVIEMDLAELRKYLNEFNH